MKTVTAEFLAAQAQNNIQYYYEINLFRRYWDTGTSAYVWETAPTDIKPYMAAKSNIAWQLDTEGLNVWRVSNVQLEIKNDGGEWDELQGLFADPYVRYMSRIEIKIGYVLEDDTHESVYSFTGLIVDDIASNSKNQTIVISLSGKEKLLTLTSAEDVCNVVAGETLGTGALNKKYFTQKPLTLSVDAVYVNGSLVSSSTYDVGEIYNTFHGASITFHTAPTLGAVITCDYTYGNNQKVLIEQIGTSELNADFETANFGVGFIDKVYVDGSELLPEIDYIVSNLNSVGMPARITLPYGAGAGQVITCDYRHWYKDVAMETLIGYLLDAAGFPAGDRSIGTINLDAFKSYKIWDNRTEFESMDTLSRNVDTTSLLGSVKVKPENFVSDIATNLNGTVSGAYPSQALHIITPPAYAHTYDAAAVPDSSSPAWSVDSWTNATLPSARHTREINPAGVLHLKVLWALTAGNSGVIYSCATDNACKTVKFSVKMGAYSGASAYILVGGVTFYRSGSQWVAVLPGGSAVNVGEAGGGWANYHTFEVFVNPAEGYSALYMDGSLLSTAGGSACIAYIIVTNGTDNGSAYVEFWLDYFYWDALELNKAIVTSAVLDLGGVTNNFGTIVRTWTPANGDDTCVMQTQTSTHADFSTGNDSWCTVVFSGNVGTIDASTTANRYLRWIITMRKVVLTGDPTLTAVWLPAHLYDKFDCGINLNEYDKLVASFQNNNGLVKRFTQTSVDNTTWGSESEVTTDLVPSTQQRYIAFRTVLYVTAIGSSPVLYSEVFSYTLASLNVALADFSGMMIQDAIEAFAQFIDYEIGVGSDGKYFFRAKNTSLIVDMELSDKTNIISIDNDVAGWYRIKNKIKAVMGKFTSIITPATEGDTEPTSSTKYGARELTIENSGISINVGDNLDLATILARMYYNLYKNPKRELRLLCKMLPQLELSDTVQVNYNVPAWYWRLGDPTKFLGRPGTIFFSKSIVPPVFTYNLITNVVGLELDINTFRLYVSVREI